MGRICPEKGEGVSRVLIAFLVSLFSPLLILAVFLYLVWGSVLYITIWLASRKPFAIFVYSESPLWKDYVEREILPHLQNRAVILNWSERRNWKTSLPVLAFRYFGGYRNFNPIGMVFRPFRFVKTYRFFEAFQEFKQGDPKKVERTKEELFTDLGV